MKHNYNIDFDNEKHWLKTLRILYGTIVRKLSIKKKIKTYNRFLSYNPIKIHQMILSSYTVHDDAFTLGIALISYETCNFVYLDSIIILL